MSVRAIIIEDEEHIAHFHKEMIEDLDPTIDIVAVCHDLETAALAIEKHQPELVFSDIMLPGGTGIELLKSYRNRKMEVIFMTAHENFWREAFEQAAVGYVLKPVSADDLEVALMNAKKRLRSDQFSIGEVLEKLERKIARNDAEKLAIPTEDGFYFAYLGSIIRLESSKVYTWIMMEDGKKILSSYNLGEFGRILPEQAFLQVHKSHIIAKQHIVNFNAKDCIVSMADGSLVPVSRRNIVSFMSHFYRPKRT